jgi:hypothetical protein
MKARFLSRIPFSEEDARLRAPVRWDLGEGADRIRLAVPLFSFARFRAWEGAVTALRLRIAFGGEPTERSVGDVLDRQAQGGNPALVIEESLDRFRRETGHLPWHFADMIAAVSDPVDVDDAWRVLEAWYANNMMTLERGGPDAFREALSEMLAHVLPVRDAVRIMVDIQKVNTEVKKNLMADRPQGESRRGLSHKQRLSQQLAQASMDSRLNKPSPASRS